MPSDPVAADTPAEPAPGEFPFLSLPFAVLGVVVAAAAHGVWASLGEGVTTVAVLGLLKWVWRRFGPRPRLSQEQVRLYSTVCIAIFLVSSSAFIGWAMEGPGSTCVDCDTTGGWVTASVFVVIECGFAAFLLFNLFRTRTRS
ncbi:MAG TPA: hypothetical protein VI452_11300 [Marmoricola sp.]